MSTNKFLAILWRLLAVLALLAGNTDPIQARPSTIANAWDITGPTGSERFGEVVAALPNGNLVIVDPKYDDGAKEDVGAVYLYNGKTRQQISMLIGSHANDLQDAKITILAHGDYVIASKFWDNGGVENAGAVTWASASAGVSGVISAATSLVGTQTYDLVGDNLRALSSGAYVVGSPYWDNGAIVDAGAATWGSASGIQGPVSAVNSLVGSQTNDQVGLACEPLRNGSYVVSSPNWNNGSQQSAGAATWGSPSGITGAVSTANSLVGSQTNDQVGKSVTPLTSGGYVVGSPYWHNLNNYNSGAATWGSASTGVHGSVSAANSLIGSRANDLVGFSVVALSSGGYVVGSPGWSSPTAYSAGAVTWGGPNGITGIISPANSLVGSQSNDNVGSLLLALTNGGYVVSSPEWDHAMLRNVGAVTWGGPNGITGVVSTTNSLVGNQANDYAGQVLTALDNGGYVVGSPWWDNGSAIDAGAATWSGPNGVIGVVSAANSLVGSTAYDNVGQIITALRDGGYVVGSPNWNNGGQPNVGAATWSGPGGIIGPVTSANSLTGSSPDDLVGQTIVALSMGGYVVGSPEWDNGPIIGAGAATWGGPTGITGTISSVNSLVGNTIYDMVGSPILPLSYGGYAVLTTSWDNEYSGDAGAVTLAGANGINGNINHSNSVLALAMMGGKLLRVADDTANRQLVVGRPIDCKVTLVRYFLIGDHWLYLPLVGK